MLRRRSFERPGCREHVAHAVIAFVALGRLGRT